MAAREASPKEASSSPAAGIVSEPMPCHYRLYFCLTSTGCKESVNAKFTELSCVLQECVFEGCQVPVRMASAVGTCPLEDWRKSRSLLRRYDVIIVDDIIMM